MHCLPILEHFNECRDPHDNMVLDLAYAARAPIIVASDKDLTDMKVWKAIEILTPRQFVEQFG